MSEESKITVRIRKDLKEAIDEYARFSNLKIQGVVEKALRAYVWAYMGKFDEKQRYSLYAKSIDPDLLIIDRDHGTPEGTYRAYDIILENTSLDKLLSHLRERLAGRKACLELPDHLKSGYTWYQRIVSPEDIVPWLILSPYDYMRLFLRCPER